MRLRSRPYMTNFARLLTPHDLKVLFTVFQVVYSFGTTLHRSAYSVNDQWMKWLTFRIFFYRMNTVKNKLVVQVRCSVVLNGDYKLGGQLLILPVQGQGKFNIKIRKYCFFILIMEGKRNISSYWIFFFNVLGTIQSENVCVFP